MSQCPECAAVLAPQWKYCVRCGAPVDRGLDSDREKSALQPDDAAPAPREISPLTLFLCGFAIIVGVLVTLALVAVFVDS